MARIAPRPCSSSTASTISQRARADAELLQGGGQAEGDLAGAGAAHTGAIDSHPQEYQRHVIAFFDHALLGAK